MEERVENFITYCINEPFSKKARLRERAKYLRNTIIIGDTIRA
jgi:hypothetical protein